MNLLGALVMLAVMVLLASVVAYDIAGVLTQSVIDALTRKNKDG